VENAFNRSIELSLAAQGEINALVFALEVLEGLDLTVPDEEGPLFDLLDLLDDVREAADLVETFYDRCVALSEALDHATRTD